LTYTSSIDGVPTCDGDVALTGTTYAGDCDGCDFAFAIGAKVTRDDGTDGCALEPLLTWVPNDTFIDLILAHSEEYFGVYGTYTDVLLAGFSYQVYEGTVLDGPYFVPIAADGVGCGTFERSGYGVSSTWDRSFTSYGFNDAHGEAMDEDGLTQPIDDGLLYIGTDIGISTRGSGTLLPD